MRVGPGHCVASTTIRIRTTRRYPGETNGKSCNNRSVIVALGMTALMASCAYPLPDVVAFTTLDPGYDAQMTRYLRPYEMFLPVGLFGLDETEKCAGESYIPFSGLTYTVEIAEGIKQDGTDSTRSGGKKRI